MKEQIIAVSIMVILVALSGCTVPKRAEETTPKRAPNYEYINGTLECVSKYVHWWKGERDNLIDVVIITENHTKYTYRVTYEENKTACWNHFKKAERYHNGTDWLEKFSGYVGKEVMITFIPEGFWRWEKFRFVDIKELNIR